MKVKVENCLQKTQCFGLPLMIFYILCLMGIEEYKAFCIYRGEHFLTWLRDGDYECHILASMGGVSENAFKDIVAILTDQKLVELYDDETKIRLTNPGRLYILNKATDIVHAGDGMLYKEAYPGGRKTQHPKDMPDIIIPSFWKHGEDKLIAISSLLHENQFTVSDTSFLYIFAAEEDGRCNWLENHTALLYLLWLLFSGSTKSVPAIVVNLAFNRFAINGEVKSLKETQSIASKIKQHLGKKEDELRGQYLTMYSIYEKAIL